MSINTMNQIEKALNDLQGAIKDGLGKEAQILDATAAFQKILREQLTRIENMNAEKVDFTKKGVVTIGIVDGDGIGPLITKQAERVLRKLLASEIEAGTIVL